MSDASLSALFLQNPELAIALRRRMEGERLSKEGTSSEPIRSPWQGVNRVAQALLGGWELRKGDEAIQAGVDRDNAEVADFTKALMGARGGAAADAAPSPTPRASPAATSPASPEAAGLAAALMGRSAQTTAPAPPSPTAGGAGLPAQRTPGIPELVTITSPAGRTFQVAAHLAPRFQGALDDLHAAGYPVTEGGGYNNRKIAGTNIDSEHARGYAIDVNPSRNPMGRTLVTDLPPNAADIFKKWGLGWGGNWTSKKDAMHISGAPHEGADENWRPPTPPTPLAVPPPANAPLGAVPGPGSALPGPQMAIGGGGGIPSNAPPPPQSPQAVPAGIQGAPGGIAPAAPTPPPGFPQPRPEGGNQSALMDIYMRGLTSRNPRIQKMAAGLAPFIKAETPNLSVQNVGGQLRTFNPHTGELGPVLGPAPEHAPLPQSVVDQRREINAPHPEVARTSDRMAQELALRPPTTVSEGQTVLGPNNQPVFTAPRAPQPYTLNPSDRRYDEGNREVAYNPEDPNKTQFPRANTLRDEFTALTKDYRTVQDAHQKFQVAAKSGTNTGDMAMLYTYVRMLDPGSVVRESEFAMAAAQGTYGQRVQGAVQRALTGEGMAPALRQEFSREAEQIYKQQRRTYETMVDRFRVLASSFGLDPKQVVIDYVNSPETLRANSTPGATPAGRDPNDPLGIMGPRR